MATEYSTQYNQAYIANTGKLRTDELHGRLRFAHFTHEQALVDAAGAEVVLAQLPAGRVRVFLGLSRAYVNWTTATAFLDLGWQAYNNINGVAVAADADGLADGIDVELPGVVALTDSTLHVATGDTYLFESQDGVVIAAYSNDTAIAVGDDLNGFIVYAVD